MHNWEAYETYAIQEDFGHSRRGLADCKWGGYKLSFHSPVMFCEYNWSKYNAGWVSVTEWGMDPQLFK